MPAGCRVDSGRGQQTATGRDTRHSPALASRGLQSGGPGQQPARLQLLGGAGADSADTGRGPDTARPGPDTEIQPAQPLDNAQSHQEAALRPQCVSQRSTLLSENDGHLMFCLMCPLSLSVSPPVAAAGLPPPPPP